ncbi:hypothetical protein SAMN05216268_106168 [Streptomyces yunnanensis]|uniref:Methyltransferase domain-containing protein n=1 Tax=Streptomyces yunnanensis TaxID=156453 RepID=A0A9X8MTM3_9ACTN|nr:hypothetical protein SAMN05216268_106168 [Streptomyces yunnanensis]
MAGVTGAEGADAAETPFDAGERLAWAGRADAFAAGFGRLCAYTVPRLLDAAGVTEGPRVLDAGTGTGTAVVGKRRPPGPAAYRRAQSSGVTWAGIVARNSVSVALNSSGRSRFGMWPAP